MENQTEEIVPEVEEVAAEAVEVVEQAAPEKNDIEEKALKMGWTPKDQFKGDPEKWRSAEEFVDRGENMLPIVRAKVKQQEQEINELKQTMQQFAEYHTKTEQRAYAKALADLKEQRAQAIAAGDGATFDRVDDAIEALRKNVEQAQPVPAPKRDASDSPEYIEWKSRNSWVNDPDMERHATEIAQNLRQAGVKEAGHEFLEMVGKKMRIAFPEKFTNPRREAAPSVEGGLPAPRKGGKTFADMPAEARSACERMAKNVFSDKPKEAAEFKANYVKQYFEEV